MRRARVVLTVAVALGLPSIALAAGARTNPQRALTRAMNRGLRTAGGADGAYVLDLTTDRPLYSSHPGTGRLPASVEKLYTTSTALLRYGPNANLTTDVLGTGGLDASGTWHGTLYLKGGGDPTFGWAGFDRAVYGGNGATVQRLASNLIHETGIRAVDGRIEGDETYFDSRRGTVATRYQASSFVEGQLSGLSFNRGYTDFGESAFQTHPAAFAAEQFEAALKADHVKLHTSAGAAVAPSNAELLTEVHSPRIATLIRLANSPSDNFVAEMLLKDIGARFGADGSSGAGAGVVRGELAREFGIHPRLDDGSGLSREDSTSPIQVVELLTALAANRPFVNSLAIGGETGTLVDEMRGTRAQGRCRGKTGTLHDVADLAGYCRARDGHTLAFAFLLNAQSDPDYGHAVEADMAVALANYDG
jgi:D-alanyl-D-alanine carboxypeptidase/D-alanyl-D-alanine-endopeptidase (penicillin-binding protein 4)